jgi:hypothetical protein
VQKVLLEGVLKQHRALLYQAQPCYRKRDSASDRARRRRKRNPAADLHHLWNEDKHRMVLSFVMTPFQVQPVIGPFHNCRPSGEPTINIDFLGKPVEVGAEVLAIPVRVTGDEPRLTVQLKVDGEISLKNGFPVLDAMMNIANYVRAIIARFQPIFETPQARRLWGLPRGGWVEQQRPTLGPTVRQGWKRTEVPLEWARQSARRLWGMSRRDWGGTVLVACLGALAGLLHGHTVLLVLLSVAAVASAAVIAWDVMGRRKATMQPQHAGIKAGEGIKAGGSIEADGVVEAGEGIEAGRQRTRSWGTPGTATAGLCHLSPSSRHRLT